MSLEWPIARRVRITASRATRTVMSRKWPIV